MAKDRDDLGEFARQGRHIQEMLQIIEDALISAGYDDYWVATQRGTFHWQTAERAQTESASDIR